MSDLLSSAPISLALSATSSASPLQPFLPVSIPPLAPLPPLALDPFQTPPYPLPPPSSIDSSPCLPHAYGRAVARRFVLAHQRSVCLFTFTPLVTCGSFFVGGPLMVRGFRTKGLGPRALGSSPSTGAKVHCIILVPYVSAFATRPALSASFLQPPPPPPPPPPPLHFFLVHCSLSYHTFTSDLSGRRRVLFCHGSHHLRSSVSPHAGQADAAQGRGAEKSLAAGPRCSRTCLLQQRQQHFGWRRAIGLQADPFHDLWVSATHTSLSSHSLAATEPLLGQVSSSPCRSPAEESSFSSSSLPSLALLSPPSFALFLLFLSPRLASKPFSLLLRLLRLQIGRLELNYCRPLRTFPQLVASDLSHLHGADTGSQGDRLARWQIALGLEY
eukprot:754655-Hanusia_phi.AAC.1